VSAARPPVALSSSAGDRGFLSASCKSLASSSYKGGPVVRHNFLDSSPSAQDFLKEESAEGASGFHAEGTPLGLRGEGAAGLDDVSVAQSVQHEHCVDISLPEEGCRRSNSGRDPDFGCLTDLTLMASLNVPPNIVSE
jgi:hypothetical protein